MCTRVILIGVDGSAKKKLVSDERLKEDVSSLVDDEYIDHITLLGLDHRNKVLGMFVGDNSVATKPFNVLATRIARNIRCMLSFRPNEDLWTCCAL